MTQWQRFGEDTWINVDHVEVVRVEEQEDGRWHLTAAFASGRVHPLGTHDDRDLLAACTDVVLRGESSDRARALLEPVQESSAAMPEPAPPAATLPERTPRKSWRFWRPARAARTAGSEAMGLPEDRAVAGPVPAAGN